MEYRIETASAEKRLLFTSQWSFSPRGEALMQGTLQDISQRHTLENQLEEATNNIDFLKQQISFDEQHALLGHWQVNLVTNKTIFSDNLYRLFGLKPQSTPAGLKHIINFIHPDDRQAVLLLHKKMMEEQVTEDIHFRIIRADGKTRYLVQKTKVVNYGYEAVLAASIHDITIQKLLEEKIRQQQEQQTANKTAQLLTEELAAVGTLTIDIATGEFACSDSLYRILGYRTNTAPLDRRSFITAIFPDDRKSFTQSIEQAIAEQQELRVAFRMITRGEMRNIVALGKIVNDNAPYLLCTLMDNTAVHRLQEALQHQVQVFDAVSNTAEDRILITDTNNTISYCNPACEAAYGIAKDKAVGANYFDVFPSNKTEEQLSHFKKVLQGEKVLIPANTSIAKKAYLDVVMHPVWDAGAGQVTGIIHVMKDVTTETLLRINLNERLSLISSLLEASVDRIIALDKNMNYLYWNKQAEAYYGLNQHDVIGKNILEVFPGLINDPSYQQFREVLKGQTIHFAAQEGIEEALMETYLLPIKDSDNRVTGVLWMMRDRTSEVQLQQQQQRASVILNALNENCYEVDKSFRITYMNDGALQYFGVRAEEVIGETLWDVFPNFLGSAVHEALRSVLDSNLPVKGEFVMPARNSHVYLSAAPTGEGLVVLFLDMEEQKKQQTGA